MPAMMDDLHASLSQLEQRYAVKLAELTALRDAIDAFRARYLERVGPLYARLEAVRARVAALAAARAREQLKDKVRHAAKLVHPDAAKDEHDRQRRHDAMIAVNEAYRRGDLDGMLQAVDAYLDDSS